MKNLSILILIGVVAAGAFALGSRRPRPAPIPTASSDNQLATQVLPVGGVELPVKWGNLGVQLIKLGVIDPTKFTPITDLGNIKITFANSREVLNSLWAFGLGNQNPILDTGPMMDKQFGGASNFASTGGWTLAVGDAMKHYSKHRFIQLNQDQQKLVEEVSKNIYRPCCNNSTYFPDCNHGMAMLGLLELMASQGMSEAEMYKYALAVNSYWFPDTYVNIAKYMAKKGTSWDKVDPKTVLGQIYSSSSGYRKILSEIEPAQLKGGGSCGA